SVERLQLSSIPLHNSGAPGWMAATASLQSPPHVVNPSRSTSKSSSTAPLQLSSMLLQTSAVREPGVQVWGSPATQLLTVRWQAPTPHVVVPRLLSTLPSQLSSMLLQTSAVGVPGVQVWGTPATQLLTVRWQAPTPHVVEPRLLSTLPSQLSSMLLQSSAVGEPGVQVWGT